MGFLSVVEHRLRLLVVLFADDNLGGHGPYRVDGRHVFVADRRPDTGAVEHRLGDLGLCDGVVLRQYNQRVVLHNFPVLVGYLKLSILLIKCKSPAIEITGKKAHLQSSVFKLSKDLIDSIHEEGIVAYTS